MTKREVLELTGALLVLWPVILMGFLFFIQILTSFIAFEWVIFDWIAYRLVVAVGFSTGLLALLSPIWKDN